jgi:hypothetical protein
MSSGKLDRNVLFSKDWLKRQLIRRCLNERRIFGYESEGTLSPGRDIQGEGEDNDYEGSIGDGGYKLSASSANIQTIYRGGR